MGLGLYPVLQMYWRAVEAALHRSHLHPIVLPPVVVVVPPPGKGLLSVWAISFTI